MILSAPIIDLRLQSIGERVETNNLPLALEAAGFLVDELNEACQPIPIQSRSASRSRLRYAPHRAKFLAITEHVRAFMQHLEVGDADAALDCIRCARELCEKPASKRAGTGNAPACA